MSTSELGNEIGIAIIGMTGRFPGAKNLEEYWENIRNGINSLRYFTDEELKERHISSALLRNPDFIKAGYIIEDIEEFDANFFNIPHSEAKFIDPQQRMFLEYAWEAMEHAGYVPGQGDDIVGVYASCAFNTYFCNLIDKFDFVNPLQSLNIILGNDKDYIASRVNYKLNLKGPACIAQSACSSSLIGISMACQSLLEYQIDMALAGGVSLDVPNMHGFLHQTLDEAVSRDCKCHAFDAEACGMASGNGIGMVVLKRLQDALEDGDTIHAVIRGFATNNDGSDKVGFIAPSVTGQQAVIAEALAISGVPPESIGYIETHGTGTILGDPIEIQALNMGYEGASRARKTCPIGSVKTNIGHLNTAAGIASVIKTAYALKRKEIPPSLNFKQPNPAIDFENTPFYVNTELQKWPCQSTPRRAGISSFGLGGNNAHIIMEEAPEVSIPTEKKSWYILPLSARTETALEKATENFKKFLTQTSETDLFNVEYTLQNGRTAFSNRKAIICSDKQDALRILEIGDAKRTLISKSPVNDKEKTIAFMFSGAGAHYIGMGSELYKEEMVYQKAVDRCATILLPIIGTDIRLTLSPKEQNAADAHEALTDPIPAMLGIFVTEYALVQLLQSRGIEPTAMIGHSLGEYVAATIAGVFSLEDALSLVAHRAQLMETIPEGAMLVALADEKELGVHLKGSLSIGAINGPSLCMVSGSTQEVDALERQLKASRIGFRRLPSGRAGHGRMMEPIMDAYLKKVQSMELNAPNIPYISNVTGDWITAEDATNPQYWVQHLRHPVRFSEGIEKLLQSPEQILVEIGPGQGLKPLVTRHPAYSEDHSIITTIRDVRQQDSDVLVFNKALAASWLAGFPLDWPKATASKTKGMRIPLPTYPFERTSHFIDAPSDTIKRDIEQANKKCSDVGKWFYVPSWKQSIALSGLQTDPEFSEKQIWLIYNDPFGLGNELAKQLKLSDQEIISVTFGDTYINNNDTFTLNPGRQDDYDALFRYLAAENRVPQRIIHLWNITPDDRLEEGIDYYERVQELGYNSLIRLMRGLASNNLGTQEIRIDVVSTNLHSVTGNETLCPEKSPLLGPCRVIPNEFPSFHCKNIDIELPKETSLDAIATLLLDEVACTHPVFKNEKTVCYRNTRRWIQDFEPLPLDEKRGENPPLRKNGVYLVTGGLGGVGYVLAEHLAKTCQPKLVLLGRTQLPERTQWEKETAQDAPFTKLMHKALHLESLGAEILPISVDVSDLKAMQKAAEDIEEKFGKIDGIIHAAGVEGGGMIELRDLADTDSNAHSKIRGTIVLEEIYKESKLDFFMICSSLASFLGAVGGVDYASANIFIDTFANDSRRRNKLNVISVNWDYWANIGMGQAILARHKSLFSEQLDKITGEDMVEAIQPHEGTDAFNRLLSTSLPQIVVSTRDLPTLLKSLQKTTGAMREVFDQADMGTTKHPRPKLANPFESPTNKTEQDILNIWENVLGIDGLGIHDPYFELGGDSLHAMPLIAQLQATFQVNIPLRAIYSHGTIAQMAEFILNEKQA